MYSSDLSCTKLQTLLFYKKLLNVTLPSQLFRFFIETFVCVYFAQKIPVRSKIGLNIWYCLLFCFFRLNDSFLPKNWMKCASNQQRIFQLIVGSQLGKPPLILHVNLRSVHSSWLESGEQEKERNNLEFNCDAFINIKYEPLF